MLVPSQLTLVGFDTPFAQKLDVNNRWVVLAEKIPWDSITNVYSKQLNNKSKGADGINPRVLIGSLIIKHMCNFSDRETINAIQENIYMQYFIGYSSFSNEVPFDPSLFVDIRKRFGVKQINEINEKILQLDGLLPGAGEAAPQTNENEGDEPEGKSESNTESQSSIDQPPLKEEVIGHEGELIVDATACPQDIRYPADLNLLNDAREKSEELIDFLCGLKKEIIKPRTYRDSPEAISESGPEEA